VFIVRGYILRSQEASVAAHARFVAQVVLADELRPSDFTHPSSARIASLDRLFRSKVLTAGVVNAALYSSNGRVAFSTQHALIGRRTTATPAVRKASSLRTISSVTSRRRVEGKTAKVLEELVPIRFREGGPAGVIAFTNDYGRVASAARRGFIPIAIVLELLFGVLFAAFVPTLRRATRQVRAHLRETESRALHDDLTGLPNRLLFEDRTHHALAQSQRDGRGAVVMLIDLDRFKQINDTLGHGAGDALLREMARRLSSVLRDCDTVARLGGDEFAVVLSGVGMEGARESAVRTQQVLEEPFTSDGLLLSVGASIGIALHPEHGTTPSELMKHADVAMYEAKRAASGYEIYDPETDTSDAERLALVSELRLAPERGEIVLHYQPKIDLVSGEVDGVEALLRWRHPAHGLITAERLMPLAEQAGVSQRIRDYALVEAIRQAGEWRRNGIEISVAVNLDARSLVDRELPSRVAAMLTEHGVEAAQIEVEITETSMLSDLTRVRAVARELAATGVILVVDDFGTGYSSLNSLSHLPIEKLKIDGSFVRRAADSDRDRAIVAATIELSHSLGLQVVAEGVEDADSLELVRALGADYAQGYHVGAPVDPAVIASRAELASEKAA
jgi:diguanylate cyclase (GGDEF)-like protein